jgi:hypothetical protein
VIKKGVQKVIKKGVQKVIKMYIILGDLRLKRRYSRIIRENE